MDMKKQRTPFVSDVELHYRPTDIRKSQACIKQSMDAVPICRSLIPPGEICLKEYFIMLMVNRAHYVVGRSIISIGGMNTTIVDPKIVFMTALGCAASGIVIAHNHPSGGVKPSQQDLQLTKRIAEGAQILDISLLDHIILSGDTPELYHSFADEGLL